MTTTIENLKDGEWSDLIVKVIQLWDNDHDSIRQVGILGDETGILKFVSWSKSDLPLMERDVEYEIRNVAISAYEDRLQASLNASTTITRLNATEETEIPTV